MITGNPDRFLEALAALPARPERARPKGVFLVLPEQFRVADESRVDNHYLDLDTTADAGRALAQATALGDAIEERMPTDGRIAATVADCQCANTAAASGFPSTCGTPRAGRRGP